MLRTDDATVLVAGDPLPCKVVRASYVVYTLSDPRDEIERYVGCTRQPRERSTQHLSMKSATAGSKLAAWFDDLRAAGLKPVFRIEAICNGHFALDGARRIERACINYLARDGKSGEKLCNEQDNPRKLGRKYWKT